jgi:hypothetical protein
MFFFRIGYSYSEKDSYDEEDGVFDYLSEVNISRKNYASDSYKFKMEKSGGGMEITAGQEVSMSQKYEKTALLNAKSEKFDEDEKLVRKKIKDFNAIIQYEENTGNKGRRKLSLLIGVKPEKFDSFFVMLKKVAINKQADITKVDKTSEYKNLNARKNSLEKIRESLIAIKKQSGKIDEYINLENRILEIEQDLQNLGVELGDFAEENEFCTMKFALAESRPIVKMSFLHRAKVALEWAVTWYFWMTLTLLFIFGFSFFFLLVIEKIKILQAIIKKTQQ